MEISTDNPCRKRFVYLFLSIQEKRYAAKGKAFQYTYYLITVSGIHHERSRNVYQDQPQKQHHTKEKHDGPVFEVNENGEPGTNQSNARKISPEEVPRYPIGDKRFDKIRVDKMIDAEDGKHECKEVFAIRSNSV